MEKIVPKAGFGTYTDNAGKDAQEGFLKKSFGLLQVFTEKALETAGKYAIACGRRRVYDEDVQKSLKYECRTFFNNVENLDEKVAEAVKNLEESSDEEEEEYESGEESGEEEESEEESEESEGGEEESVDEEEKTRFQPLKHNIDAISINWEKFKPTDPVLVMIKNAIDNTDEKILGQKEEEGL